MVVSSNNVVPIDPVAAGSENGSRAYLRVRLVHSAAEKVLATTTERVGAATQTFVIDVR